MEKINTVKKGVITEVVPERCWLWPYIGYEVQWDDHHIIVGGHPYGNENYEKRGYVKEVNLWDEFFSETI